MTRTYNIDEIFEMAEQIERNGVAFYRRAAEVSMDEERKRKLLDLAEMEASHECTFAAMRTEQENAPTSFDPDGEAARYLDAIIREEMGHVTLLSDELAALSR